MYLFAVLSKSPTQTWFYADAINFQKLVYKLCAKEVMNILTKLFGLNTLPCITQLGLLSLRRLSLSVTHASTHTQSKGFSSAPMALDSLKLKILLSVTAEVVEPRRLEFLKIPPHTSWSTEPGRHTITWYFWALLSRTIKVTLPSTKCSFYLPFSKDIQ